ncbi:MAG: hypothetical protein HY765_02285 [Rhodomicrobium sp.]|nr:hypothetical protein [Rhodomicrobium sp.]
MVTRIRYPKGYQFFDGNGAPLALGNLYYYVAGTTTLQDTYSGSAGTIANTNPIVLDGSGRLDVDVYLGAALPYKEILTDVNGAAVSPWPDDNIPAAGQADWNAVSGPAVILIKPVFAPIAYSGSWADLSGVPATNSPFTGDAGSGGASGLVPAPAAGDTVANKFLSASGAWVVPPGSSSSAATNLTASETATTVSIASSSGTGATIPAATSSLAGVLDAARAAKIDGKPSIPSDSDFVGATGSSGGTHGLVPAPAAGQEALFLRADGTWAGGSLAQVNSDWNATSGVAQILNKPSAFTGATAIAAGATGFVPAPAAGQQGSLLRGDATWSQNLDNIARLGVNTTDTGNVLSVNGPSALFSNSGDMRATISKGSAANVAAFNFQDNFSTRVQFGLLGNDNFTISASPDGTTFNNAIVATSTGAVSFPNSSGFTGDTGAGGAVGLVPAPAAGDAVANKFLKADGAWTALGSHATLSGRAACAALGATYNASSSTGEASITGTSAETIFTNGSILIPAGSMGANGSLRVTLAARVANNANAKTLRIRFGPNDVTGTVFLGINLASTLTVRVQVEIRNIGSQSSQEAFSYLVNTGWGTTALDFTAGTIDTSIDRYLVISGALSNTADTITLVYSDVEIMYRA